MKYLYAVDSYDSSSELYHHGTKGMKWGDRRYQYEDGTLTPEGYRHYGYGHGGGGVGRSEHTKMMTRAGRKEGLKRGAKLGLASGIGIGAIGAYAAKTLGMGNKEAAVVGGALGLGQLALSSMSGALKGASDGKRAGRRETQAARDHIEQFHNKKLQDFIAKDDADYKRRKQNRG